MLIRCAANATPSNVHQKITTAFRAFVQFLPSELATMPLDRWSESVVRYFYCKEFAELFPGVHQLVECDKIDLVLREGSAIAFVEFKFYRHPIRFDPYDGSIRGFKGGPGAKNLLEFQSCVKKLHSRRSTESLSKFIILLYADPVDSKRPNLRFSTQYDQYRHPNEGIPLLELEFSESIAVADATIRARLFEIGAPPTCRHTKRG